MSLVTSTPIVARPELHSDHAEAGTFIATIVKENQSKFQELQKQQDIHKDAVENLVGVAVHTVYEHLDSAAAAHAQEEADARKFDLKRANLYRLKGHLQNHRVIHHVEDDIRAHITKEEHHGKEHAGIAAMFTEAAKQAHEDVHDEHDEEDAELVFH
ncbi:hypothetical protein DRE_00741 [Drechslerella stenobrocha 248]|uniref:Uncharacterized protein n=1 Tax=Drechslerella stenobrocha 248 TaxID=1043628 RepID=W7HYS1_9PEZI|nr:hypothetical protein DRE_00741 [Drechslerella stenobrocha 248]